MTHKKKPTTELGGVKKKRQTVKHSTAIKTLNNYFPTVLSEIISNYVVSKKCRHCNHIGTMYFWAGNIHEGDGFSFDHMSPLCKKCALEFISKDGGFLYMYDEFFDDRRCREIVSSVEVAFWGFDESVKIYPVLPR